MAKVRADIFTERHSPIQCRTKHYTTYVIKKLGLRLKISVSCRRHVRLILSTKTNAIYIIQYIICLVCICVTRVGHTVRCLLSLVDR